MRLLAVVFGLAVLSLVLTLSGLMPSPVSDQPEHSEWIEDFDYMVDQLKSNHADLYHKIDQASFEEMAQEIRRSIPHLQRHEILVQFARLLAAVGDAHTGIYLSNDDVGFREYPVRFYEFSDGIYVREASLEHQDLLGSKVLKIGDFLIQEAYDKILEVVSHDSNYHPPSVTRYMALVEVLGALGIVRDMERAPFTLLDRDGEVHVVELTPYPEKIGVFRIETTSDQLIRGWQLTSQDPALYLKDTRNQYWYEYLSDNQTMYVQLNQWRNKSDGPSQAEFYEEVFSFVDSHPVDNFVLDLRVFIGGGDSAISLPLVLGIMERPEFNQRGNLFVLIGPRAYSAPIHLAVDLERLTNAIFIGEPMGAGPNHYNESFSFELPNSEINGTLSSWYWQLGYPWDDRDAIEPELYVPLDTESYIQNTDPVLDEALSYVVEPPIYDQMEQLLDSEGLQAALDAYHAYVDDEKNRYQVVYWEIYDLAYELLDEGRAEPAIELFKLDVLKFPEAPWAYDGLAEAYEADDQIQEAIDFFRSLLDEDSENELAKEMLDRFEEP